jgi:hypothetical protein
VIENKIPAHNHTKEIDRTPPDDRIHNGFATHCMGFPFGLRTAGQEMDHKTRFTSSRGRLGNAPGIGFWWTSNHGPCKHQRYIPMRPHLIPQISIRAK